MAPLLPTTRFNTAEEFEDCRKRVISLGPIEKLCQLMIALAELVIVSVLPEPPKLALPEATVPPVGLARLCVADTPKHAATDSVLRRVGQLGPETVPMHELGTGHWL